MLNFDFVENGLRKVSPPHFVYNCSRKMSLMLCSVNFTKWPNLIASLSLLSEILVSMCIAIFC